ncbi:hypothetical protein DSM104299_03241 [Baekduia alba]|uniref:hypothetical protein n=1 Tax=Baekduia alba TaxID=2997333 RepID=UPI00234249A9|nr:hypothetical protein [Baekduia alba]WCB94504.1 hypothetical protein DSM104299_03241 [Baekduia alba]
MATKTKVGVRLTGRFTPGTEVDLYPRIGVMFDRAHVGSPIATATVDEIGTVDFDDVDASPGDRFWIAGADEDDVWRGVQVTAKARDGDRPRLGGDEIRDRLAQTRPPSSAVAASTTTGARSTTSTRVVGIGGQPFANSKVGLPTPDEDRDPNPAPYPRIEDVEPGTVLRSHTVTGEAHPVDLEVPDGQLRQDQVSADVFQASCTPLGTATVLPQQPGQPESATVEGDTNERVAAQKATPKKRTPAKRPAKRKASSTAKKPVAKKAQTKPAGGRATARKPSPKKS